jgi:hypothetical protein
MNTQFQDYHDRRGAVLSRRPAWPTTWAPLCTWMYLPEHRQVRGQGRRPHLVLLFGPGIRRLFAVFLDEIHK